jgi:hypothetical protein
MRTQRDVNSWVREPFFCLLVQGALCLGVLSLLFGTVPHLKQDSGSYLYFSTESLEAMLSQVRTVGYPLFLRAFRMLSPNF